MPAWGTHVDGAAALVKTRGNENFSTPLACMMFLFIRRNSVSAHFPIAHPSKSNKDARFRATFRLPRQLILSLKTARSSYRHMRILRIDSIRKRRVYRNCKLGSIMSCHNRAGTLRRIQSQKYFEPPRIWTSISQTGLSGRLLSGHTQLSYEWNLTTSRRVLIRPSFRMRFIDIQTSMWHEFGIYIEYHA